MTVSTCFRSILTCSLPSGMCRYNLVVNCNPDFPELHSMYCEDFSRQTCCIWDGVHWVCHSREQARHILVRRACQQLSLLRDRALDHPDVRVVELAKHLLPLRDGKVNEEAVMKVCDWWTVVAQVMGAWVALKPLGVFQQGGVEALEILCREKTDVTLKDKKKRFKVSVLAVPKSPPAGDGSVTGTVAL